MRPEHHILIVGFGDIGARVARQLVGRFRITALVRNAVGFNEPRGDRVEVVSMRFAEPELGSRDTGPLGLDIPQAVLISSQENFRRK